MHLPLALAIATERWPIAGSFDISRGRKTEAVVVVAELSDGVSRGRGECVPYSRYGESVASVTAQINAMRPQLEGGLDRRLGETGLAADRPENVLQAIAERVEHPRPLVPARAVRRVKTDVDLRPRKPLS